jgi:hypothetical protein
MHPLYNFQGSAAPLSALAFLGTAALLALLCLACMVQLARRSFPAALRLALIGGGVLAAYLLLLTGMSLASRRQAVQPGNAKYFCELDCHLAYSVVGSRRVPAPTAGGAEAWQVVTVRVWFDPRSIGPRRGDAPLYPNPRSVRLRDASGRLYDPSAEGLAALERTDGRQTPLDTPLRPGGSYTSSLVFRVPAGASTPELLLSESDPVTRLLIGHENSLFHAPVPFRLAGTAPAAQRRG